MGYRHIGQMLLERIQQSGDSIAFRRRQGGSVVDLRWRDVAPRLDRLAAGLLAAGVDEHGAVTILGNTSLEWVLCDFACQTIGLRTVPIYASLLPEEVGYVHVDTGATLCIVENAEQLAKVREMQRGFRFFDVDYAPEQIKVRKVVVIDPTGCSGSDWESLESLEARGAAALGELAARRAAWLAPIQRDRVATYTYTSGTTGPPKAVIQTHENMLSFLEGVEKVGLFDGRVQEGGLFLFLPLAHSFGRLIELAGPYFNAAILLSSVPTLGEDLPLFRPGFFPAAPRVYEKLKAKIEGAVAGAPAHRRSIFRWALGVGKATIPYRSRGKPLPLPLRFQRKVAERLVFGPLRKRLGLDRAAIALSGSAPLDVEVHEFFLALGITLLEAYGLTETCPGLTANLPEDFRLGTVGKALPGVTLRLLDDGEILAKGPNITQGYLNRPDATGDAFDDEGWFHTGDLGAIDADGFVKITGRKKELIKTSGGKYVAPSKIEGRLKNHPIIQEAVVVGDRRNYCVALIAIDPEELATWAKQQGVAPDLSSPAVLAAVQGQVDAVNGTLASFESIKRFRVLPEPVSVANGILTASLKVKRRVVEERYASLIEDMYRGEKD